MESLKSSLIYSFAQKYGEILVAFVSTLILARLLTPEEVGVYSLIATLVAISHMVRDFGISNYIVQEQKLTDEKIMTSFLVTLCISYSIGLLFFIFKGPIAHFFGHDGLADVLSIVCVGFFLIPFGSVSLNLLRKDMQFKKLFWVNLSSVVFNSVCSIVLAYQGWGSLSLAIGGVVGILTTVIMSSWFRRKVRLVWPRGAVFRYVLGFGMKSSYVSFLNMFIMQFPEMIIGKISSMEMVGLYSRANGLSKLFNMGVLQGLYPVLLPHLVRKLSDGHDIRQDYLRVVEVVACLAFPFYIFLFIYSETIIHILYGDQWIKAAELVSYIAISAGVLTVSSLNVQVLLAMGKIDTNVKMQTVIQIITLGLLIGAAFWSVEAVLIALVIGSFVNFFISFGVVAKHLEYRISQLFTCFSGALLVAILLLAECWGVSLLGWEQDPSLIQFIGLGVLYCSLWFAGAVLISKSVKEMLVSFMPKRFRDKLRA
jgi:O-antigen/teichoic acid export membrane protein